MRYLATAYFAVVLILLCVALAICLATATLAQVPAIAAGTNVVPGTTAAGVPSERCLPPCVSSDAPWTYAHDGTMEWGLAYDTVIYWEMAQRFAFPTAGYVHDIEVCILSDVFIAPGDFLPLVLLYGETAGQPYPDINFTFWPNPTLVVPGYFYCYTLPMRAYVPPVFYMSLFIDEDTYPNLYIATDWTSPATGTGWVRFGFDPDNPKPWQRIEEVTASWAGFRNLGYGVQWSAEGPLVFEDGFESGDTTKWGQ